MSPQTQDSAGIMPLVCFELLTLAFAMAAEPDAPTVVIALPQGKETVLDACQCRATTVEESEA
jgi:hypothetical protein